MAQKKHLALFDPYAGGHHGLFVQHLVRYWGDHRVIGTLELMVTDAFLEKHPQVNALIDTYPEADILIRRIPPLPPRANASTRALLQNDRQQGQLLASALEAAQPSHVLLMYFDHLQVSLATRLRKNRSLHMAGIYFRPSFHYPIQGRIQQSFTQRVKQLRKKVQLRFALRNPTFKTLFSLDPYVVPTIQKMTQKTRVLALPDGVEHALDTVDSPQESWGVEEGRLLALCFGSLARRKGIFSVLEALPHLQRALQSRLALVFAGAVVASERNALLQKITEMRDQTQVQIVLDDRFVHDAEVHPMIKRADLVLVPYQHHIGSSNVLIRAAYAGIPVLGSNYGLMGAQIAEHHLGTALDSTNPVAIADGLAAHITTNTPTGFDPTSARAFGMANSADAYAETIFSSLDFV